MNVFLLFLPFATVFAGRGSVVPVAAPPKEATKEGPISTDRPNLAESASAVAKGVTQIEVGFVRNELPEQRDLLFPFLIRYGLGSGRELWIETDALYGTARMLGSNGRFSDAGSAPISIGAKVRLESDRPALGVIVRYFPAGGRGSFASDGPAGDLRLAADAESGRWSLATNIGVAFARDQVPVGLAVVSVGYEVTETIGGFGEFAAAVPVRGERSLIFDTGVTWRVTNNLQLDAYVGQTLAGPGPRPFLGAGFSYRFR